MFQRALIVAVLAVLPVCAQAEVLYVQTPVFSSARASDYGTSTNAGWRMYDDFVLADSASVETVIFRGMWLGPQGSAPAPDPDVSAWNVSFFANAAGLPGSVVSSQDLAPAAVSLSLLGTTTWSFDDTDIRNVKIYDISVTLPSAVALAGGTRYWFSPLTLSNTEVPQFTWLGSDIVSPGLGKNRSIQQRLVGSTTTVTVTDEIGRDRALRLEGTVPEPASLTLLGLAGAAVFARRRRVR